MIFWRGCFNWAYRKCHLYIIVRIYFYLPFFIPFVNLLSLSSKPVDLINFLASKTLTSFIISAVVIPASYFVLVGPYLSFTFCSRSSNPAFSVGFFDISIGPSSPFVSDAPPPPPPPPAFAFSFSFFFFFFGASASTGAPAGSAPAGSAPAGSSPTSNTAGSTAGSTTILPSSSNKLGI